MTAKAIDYPEDIKAICEGLRGFVEVEVVGRHKRYEEILSDPRKKYTEDGRLTPEVVEIIRELRMVSAEAGYFGLSVPKELGGSGFGALAYYAAWEEIYKICGGHGWLSRWAIAHWARGPSPVLTTLQPELRSKVIDGLLRGETSLCFCMSEPEAGSDAMSMGTRAIPEGDGWRLNGQKIWITNGAYADYAIVFAVTNPELAAERKGGISGFFVPTDSEGFKVVSTIAMHGHLGSDEAILAFDDIYVGPEQLMGELDKGFAIGLKGVSLGRVYNMARAIGLGHWALRKAVDYSKVRKTFGETLSSYQGIMFPLAEASMELHAGRLMAMNVSRLIDEGKRAVKEISMGKAFCVQAGTRAIDASMQAHGAMGFTNEMAFTEAYGEVRRAHIADGSNEILRRTIVSELLKGNLDI